MALVKTTLKTMILAAFTSQITKKENPAAALDDLSDKLATAIDAYIRSGTVTGTCATPAGAGTITGIVI